MKSESVIGQSPRNIHNEIATVSADLSIVTRAEVTKIFEYRIAKIHENVKVEVVETFVETFEDAL